MFLPTSTGQEPGDVTFPVQAILLVPYSKFHAPSWSWATYKGCITYLNPPMGASRRVQLIRTLRFETLSNCLQVSSKPCVSGICGNLSFSAPCQVALATESLASTGWESDSQLIPVMGSPIHWESSIISRQGDTRATSMPKRKLTLPLETRILRSKVQDEVIGWVLFDTEAEQSCQEIVYAALLLWTATGKPDIISRSKYMLGYDYDHEEIVDFIALHLYEESPPAYKRIGRGRIVKSRWMATCTEQHFSIF
jgi:hypothetical protein